MSKNLGIRFWISILIAFILTKIPFINIPLKWLETYFHELSHGLMTLLTGGHVEKIELFINGTGLCYTKGGSPILIAMAGYIGASFFGALLFYLSQKEKGVKLWFVSLCIFLSIIFWGRDILTIIILLVVMAIFLLPIKFNFKYLDRILEILALVVVLNALNSPLYLIGSNLGDAKTLASLTIIPAFIWILLWLATSLSALYFCFRVKKLS